MGYQPALIVLSTLAILLLIPPAIWHVRTVNIPLITLVCWLLLMDIKLFVDAIIWGGKDFAHAFDGRGYCDVMIKVQVGANVGISSAVAGVMYNLYRILRADGALPGLHSFKKVATDLAITLLTPVIVMCLSYVVQTRRYVIVQYSGCQTATAESWVTVVCYTLWVLVWAVVGVVFAVLVIVTYFQKRKDARDILRCTNSGLNLARFAKLLSFCCVVILVMFPVSIYLFQSGLNTLKTAGAFNYKLNHSHVLWDVISFLPLKSPFFTTWVYLALSYIVFIFFGLGSDAISMYLQFFSRIGLSSVVGWFEARRSKSRARRADQLVSSLLDRTNITTPTSGTQFDLEMQRIMKKEDDDSGTTKSFSTEVTNVFADNEEFSKRDFQYLTGMGELDEDDIEFINMLYREDPALKSSHLKNSSTEAPLSLSAKTPSTQDNTPTSMTDAADEFGVSCRITRHFV